jgi:hypothetical protein
MSTAAKLGGFAGVMAALFALGLVVGAAVGPL